MGAPMEKRISEWNDPVIPSNHDLRNALIFVLLYPLCFISGILFAMVMHL